MNIKPLIGAIAGDIIGFPYEIQDGPFKIDKLTLPNPLTWSDDSSMMLATCDAMNEFKMFGFVHTTFSTMYELYRRERGMTEEQKKVFDSFPIALMDKFLEWYENNKYSPVDYVIDIGCATENAVLKYKETKDIYTCGETDDFSFGNGALMRILPFGLVNRFRIRKEITDAATALTHNNDLCKYINWWYVKLIQRLLCNSSPPPHDVVLPALNFKNELIGHTHEMGCPGYVPTSDVDKRNYKEWLELPVYKFLTMYNKKESAKLLEDPDFFKISATVGTINDGFVLTALSIALYANLTSNSFEEVIIKTIELGGDTDTNACIAGGIAGCLFEIPEYILTPVKKIIFDNVKNIEKEVDL